MCSSPASERSLCVQKRINRFPLQTQVQFRVPVQRNHVRNGLENIYVFNIKFCVDKKWKKNYKEKFKRVLGYQFNFETNVSEINMIVI